MPPFLALLLCVAVIIWLLRREVAFAGRMSAALWIPLVWLLIYSTRPVAIWLGSGGASEVEGNLLDAVIIFGLIFAACIVLSRRGFPFGTLPSLNAAYFVVVAYFAISILWAPYPFVAFKRLFKECGLMLMVMVILTEPNPAAAFKTLCVRCAIVLFPLSVVLIKYYPAYGRSYASDGGQMITGVTGQKNSLGAICAIYGLVLVWDMIDAYRERGNGQKRMFLLPKLMVFSIGMWLLISCQSKTSLLAFLCGITIFFSTYIKLIRRSAPFFAKCVFLSISIGLITTAFWTFAVAPMLQALNRDTTFTERTMIWEKVLKQDVNPLIGSGYYSFWLDKGSSVWADFSEGFVLRTVHSGYLEMYLDGGIIGCILLGAFLLVTCWRMANLFSHASSFSRVLFAFAIMVLIMNFSESSLFRPSPNWFCFLLVTFASHRALFPRETVQERQSLDSPVEIIAGTAA
jgi:exopolysaccharide production protein ExoQ